MATWTLITESRRDLANHMDFSILSYEGAAPLIPFTCTHMYLMYSSESRHSAPSRTSPPAWESMKNKLLPADGCFCPVPWAVSQHRGSSSWQMIWERSWESDATCFSLQGAYIPVSLNTGSNKKRWDLFTAPHLFQPTSSSPCHACVQGFKSGPCYQCACNRLLLPQGLLPLLLSQSPDTGIQSQGALLCILRHTPGL